MRDVRAPTGDRMESRTGMKGQLTRFGFDLSLDSLIWLCEQRAFELDVRGSSDDRIDGRTAKEWREEAIRLKGTDRPE